MTLWFACLAAQFAAVLTAARLARRHSSHRPVLALLVFWIVADVAIKVGQVAALEPWRAAYPHDHFTGALRAWYHVETALVTARPAAVAARAWRCFHGAQNSDAPGRTSGASSHMGAISLNQSIQRERATWRPPWSLALGALDTMRILPSTVKVIFCLWLAFNAALIVAYPLPRGWTQPALHAFEAACVVLGAVAIVTGWARRRERAASVAFYLVAVELVVATAGPYARNVFADWRTVGAAMYAVAFSLLAAAQWRWTHWTSSASVP